jgi:histidinol-phosphate aminotransferase
MKLPPFLKDLPVYLPGETLPALAARLGRPVDSIIKLDSNENPYGVPKRVHRALAALPDGHLYPDAEYRALREALSAYTGVPVEHLIPGNGSDELLGVIAHTLLEPGDRVLVCPPTFSQYSFYTKLNAAEVVSISRKADFSLDLDGISAAAEKSSPKLIFLDTPGNPTGLRLAGADIEALLNLPLLVVLDEAYIEFTDFQSMIREVIGRENLVVLRTFSKWAGLAGFRIGYGAFPGWLAPAIWKVKSPFNVTTPAAVAAIAALSDVEAIHEVVSAIRGQRDRMAAELAHFPGLTVYPSEANFLLVRVEPAFGRSALEIYSTLKELGILVRPFEDMNCLRITAGRPEQVDALLNALDKTVLPYLTG